MGRCCQDLALPYAPTKFTSALAVDTWDTHFRWRVGDELCDRTIDATWFRVAQALSKIETHGSARWQERFMEAFRRWEIVPDARLLKHAGTDQSGLRLPVPRATLNLASFVRRTPASVPHFDATAFASAAELAVRLLDNAMMRYGCQSEEPAVAVGLMGFADALAYLGVPYLSSQACKFAQDVGKSLSVACTGASMDLQRQRGQHVPAPAKWGRFSALTAIHSQPLLAQLANQASDALDPLLGCAWDFSARGDLPFKVDACDAEDALLQQVNIRSAMQPWIDAPISYPVVYYGEFPNENALQAGQALARHLGLAELHYRRSEQPTPCDVV